MHNLAVFGTGVGVILVSLFVFFGLGRLATRSSHRDYPLAVADCIMTGMFIMMCLGGGALFCYIIGLAAFIALGQ